MQTCSFEEFEQFVHKHPRFFAKLPDGAGGAGARVVELALVPLEVGVLEASGGIRAGGTRGRERRDRVADPIRALVRQQLRADGRSVERPGHDLERAETALCGAVAKTLVHCEERQKVRLCEGVSDPLVKDGPVGGEPIGAVLRKLVGEVAGGNVNDAAAEALHRALDLDPEPIVLERRETREPHSHNLETAIALLNEVQRDEHAPVEVHVALAVRARLDSRTAGTGGDLPHELGVVGDVRAVGPVAKVGKVPVSAATGRDVKIVEVGGGVRAGDHDGLRLQEGNPPCDLLIGGNGPGDAGLPAMAHPGHGKRRMGNNKRGDDRHGGLPHVLETASFLHSARMRKRSIPGARRARVGGAYS